MEKCAKRWLRAMLSDVQPLASTESASIALKPVQAHPDSEIDPSLYRLVAIAGSSTDRLFGNGECFWSLLPLEL